MKKLLFLAAIAVTLISCERGFDNVTNNETSKFEKQHLEKHEKKSSKTASDTLSVSNISSAAGNESTSDPIDDVDPNDIKTPPRKTTTQSASEESEDVDPKDIQTPPRK